MPNVCIEWPIIDDDQEFPERHLTESDLLECAAPVVERLQAFLGAEVPLRLRYQFGTTGMWNDFIACLTFQSGRRHLGALAWFFIREDSAMHTQTFSVSPDVMTPREHGQGFGRAFLETYERLARHMGYTAIEGSAYNGGFWRRIFAEASGLDEKTIRKGMGEKGEAHLGPWYRTAQMPVTHWMKNLE